MDEVIGVFLLVVVLLCLLFFNAGVASVTKECELFGKTNAHGTMYICHKE